MIKYITVLNKDKISLNLMGRTATFTKDQEVTENAYTKAYPQYFKRIGEITGFSNFLAKPTFLADPIDEFVNKEAERKKYITIVSSEPAKIEKDDVIMNAIQESIDEDFDVKIEID